MEVAAGIVARGGEVLDVIIVGGGEVSIENRKFRRAKITNSRKRAIRILVIVL